MPELVGLIVHPEDYGTATEALMDWQRQQGAKSAIWTEGDTSDGRKRLFDVPRAAVEFLRQRGISCDTTPRDPRRPIFGHEGKSA
ncbi:MAG: hypothetical protein KGO02_24085 [Alphaproteobacteria bacterium]|nr:hypothetical protein [Alphaproteobacteria bacterium]